MPLSLTGLGGGATSLFRAGSAGPSKFINILFRGKFGPSNHIDGATVGTYWSAASKNQYGAGSTNEYVQSDFTRVGDGILKFNLVAARYKIFARSGSGSGSYSWTGMSTECEFTIGADTDVMLLIPNHGGGSYSAGGGLFFIGGTDYTNYVTQIPFLILGGGGGGYSHDNDFVKPGPLQTNLYSTTRRGPSSGTGGDYDGGAAWKNDYTPSSYDGNAAKHFVQGGKGGNVTSCGSNRGGFGGGAGSCPGGGGGLQGGYPGTNTHNGGAGSGGSQNWSGGQHGGGGGTSYYNSTYISNITNTSYGGSRGGSGSGLNSEDSSEQGYFGIYTIS
tara:strand:+ start:84 stop:1076 length:993 start_codon:yes stop_codon:yes gene_type:complete